MGSSSSSRSGWLSSSLHSATRRRSPPESTVTSASGGGQRSASMACSSWESRSQALAWSSSSWSLPISAISVVGVVGRHQLGDLVEAVELALDLGDALLDVAEHVLGLVELRLLQEDADGVAGRQERVAVGRLVQPGHDLEHGGLAGAVGTDHADLRARVEGQRHVIEDDLVAVRLARLAHRVDELSQEKPSAVHVAVQVGASILPQRERRGHIERTRPDVAQTHLGVAPGPPTGTGGGIGGDPGASLMSCARLRQRGATRPGQARHRGRHRGRHRRRSAARRPPRRTVPAAAASTW